MKKLLFLTFILFTTVSYSQILTDFDNGKITLLENGNFGIGTTNPTQQFQIGSSSNNLSLYNDYINYVNHMVFESRDNNDGGAFVFRSNKDSVTNDLLTITRYGNVGIGITNPTIKFQVSSGSIPADSYPPIAHLDYRKEKDYDMLFLERKGKTNQGPSIFMKGLLPNGNSFTGRIALIGEGNGCFANMTFLTSNNKDGIWNQSEVMRLTSDGNVGIGTTAPKNRLSVEGTIWAQEVKISLTDAADWVFDEDYKLRTIEEVELFVKENKHLPDVPSADDFRKNDLKVSEMTNKLLQKIEELTLYTIEQNKQLIEQNKQIKTLQEKVEALENKE